MPEETNETVNAETNTPEVEETAQDTLPPEGMQKELERARKEAAKYRTQLREREEAEKKAAEDKRQAELTAEERAKEAERKAQEALEAAEARVQAAERRAALAGKVTNAERVLKLLDNPEEYFDGSEPNVEAILKDFPEYTPGRTSVGASTRPAEDQRTSKPTNLTEAINQHYNR